MFAITVLLAIVAIIFMFLWALYYRKYYKEKEKNIRLGVLYEKEKENAIIDPLTGLYNRRLLDQRIIEEKSRATRHQQNFITLFMDLDNFKEVNDKYGHKIGDLVLKKVASKLKRITRQYDIAVRYGGDEFVVILIEISLESAILLAEKIIQSIKDIEINGANMGLSVSMGIHQFNLNTYSEDPIKEADNSMYQVKRNGKNAISVLNKIIQA